MKVAYFVPCYIDTIAPQVAISTFELLLKLGVEVFYPNKPTCCGLPFTDMGYHEQACEVEQNFANYFAGYDHVVIPSGICAEQVRNHFDSIEQTEAVVKLRNSTYDIVEFLHDVLKVNSLPWANFPHKVGLHNGCHSLRYLHHARPSELVVDDYSKTENLLRLVEGIEVIYPERKDECCGFGGTFSIWDKRVAAQMGCDKVTDFHTQGAEYIVSADYSCMLHQGGVSDKLGLNIKTLYISEILNGSVR